MRESFFVSVASWLTRAGLAGTPEIDIVTGFCERCVAEGLPLDRGLLLIDTLHPVHEGRLFRWGFVDGDRVHEYGRTSAEHLAAAGASDAEIDAAQRWTRSPFYHLLQIGESSLRRRIDATTEAEFSILADMRQAGMTDYIAIIERFAAEGTIGDMDCVYMSWATRSPEGFSDDHYAALRRLAAPLSLAIKSVSLTRVTTTLMETYLGRDAGRRVLTGRIMRGIADRLQAVIWFSDLRGFTRITDTAPEQVIPLLNEYADVIFSAIDDHSGDVLKLIGDGTLAIFPLNDGGRACADALDAAIAARAGIAALQDKRAAAGLPLCDMYVGLHLGEVFYGNIGSRERLDFTVIGPAVNEASRIAAMCRSVDQPLLTSSAFANADGVRERLLSVGRYALRGVARPQELFTLDPER